MRHLATFLVGAAVGALSGATLVGLFLSLFSPQAEAWERRQIDRYIARFPTTSLPTPTYTFDSVIRPSRHGVGLNEAAQRTYGGSTLHVDWAESPAT